MFNTTLVTISHILNEVTENITKMMYIGEYHSTIKDKVSNIIIGKCQG